MRVLITGATGFVGTAVTARFLREGWSVAALTRDPSRARLPADVEPVAWNQVGEAPSLPGRFDAVVHLAGASIAGGLWTRGRKRTLWASRVDATRTLIEALARTGSPPSSFVSASGMGYYGDCGDRTVHPGDAPGTDFLGRMARVWEAESRGAEALGARVATVRLGMVLGRDGGALAPMRIPFGLGLGAILGSGKQYWPWIHLEDAANVFYRAATDAVLQGPLHGAAGDAVTQREFARALAVALRRPLFLRAPAPCLRLALGEFADLFLHGQRAVPCPVPLRWNSLQEAFGSLFDA